MNIVLRKVMIVLSSAALLFAVSSCDYETNKPFAVGNSGYETLEEAFDGAEQNGTIRLTKDVTLTDPGTIDINCVPYTLDLDGHTLKIEVSNAYDYETVFGISGAMLTIKDSSQDKTGIIKSDSMCGIKLICGFYKLDGITICGSENTAVVISDDSVLVVENCVIDGGNIGIFSANSNTTVGGDDTVIRSEGLCIVSIPDESYETKKGILLDKSSYGLSIVGGSFSTDPDSKYLKIGEHVFTSTQDPESGLYRVTEVN